MADNQNSQKNTLIRVRPKTREKLDAIQRATRLSFIEIADVLADRYMASEGIRIGGESRRPKTAQA